METVDTIIKGGRIIDPKNGVDAIMDVAVKGSAIYAVTPNIKTSARDSFDASGCIVTPGLIDAHVHCYEYVTPLGINPDRDCLARGTTTIVDAGSAGASTFPGLRKFIMEPSKTRVLCLLHIAAHGLASAGCAGAKPGGESDTLSILDEVACEQCINSNRDVIRGVKVRLSASVCAEGKTEEAAYRQALSVAKKCKVPLMTHHSNSSIPSQKSPGCAMSCPGDLRAGDIYTHTFHGYADTILDPRTRQIYNDVIDSRKRGVLFDVGHGAGAFSWTVATICAENNFWPDLISTDLHTVNVDGPAYDLPTVMTKMLTLGMPLYDIVRAVTSTPAKALGLEEEIGSLDVGKEADITVLKLEDCDAELEDSQGQTRNVRQKIKPVAVWRAGVRYHVTEPNSWPSVESRQKSTKRWKVLEIRDDTEPKVNSEVH